MRSLDTFTSTIFQLNEDAMLDCRHFLRISTLGLHSTLRFDYPVLRAVLLAPTACTAPWYLSNAAMKDSVALSLTR